LLKERVAGHRAADLAAGRAVDEAEYVSVEWAMEKLRRQQWVCSSCYWELDYEGSRGLSIDRVSSDLAHYQFNCTMSCLSCNVGRGKGALE
jgi:hypothetical protein